MSRIIELHPDQTATGAPARERPTSMSDLGDRARLGHASLIARTTAGEAALDDQEPVLEIEQIVALVLRTCRRLGHRPARLRPIIAADLARHCRRGDPTALMLRDWLDGRMGLVPDVAGSKTARLARSGREG